MMNPFAIAFVVGRTVSVDPFLPCLAYDSLHPMHTAEQLLVCVDKVLRRTGRRRWSTILVMVLSRGLPSMRAEI